MPELIEVETYRSLAQRRALGRTVARVHAPDDWFLKETEAPEVVGLLEGRRFVAARRIGKLMVLDTDDGTVLGLRFGMTGRLLVDGAAAIERLEYSSDRDDPAWDRFGVDFADGGGMVLRDPRRLGGIELDPDLTRLGVDATRVTIDDLVAGTEGSTAPVKSRLMDQSFIAGLGNLLCDDVLWRAGLAPVRPCVSLTMSDLGHLVEAVHDSLEELTERGGSHTGALQEQRHDGGRCPADGAELRRDTVGGRTSWWCVRHQR